MAISQWPRILCHKSTSSAAVLIAVVEYLCIELIDERRDETEGGKEAATGGIGISRGVSTGSLNNRSVGSKDI